jgi:hypothetical protein
MTAEAKTFLWTTSIYVPSANTDRAETHEVCAFITRFGAANIVRSNRAVIKAENLHPASIVPARPLPINPARFVYAKSKRRRALSRTTEMLAAKGGFVAEVLKPNHHSTCRNDQ